MATRTFTADDGEKFELTNVRNGYGVLDGQTFALKSVKLIKAVEKAEYLLVMGAVDENYLFKKEYTLTEPTAQAVADAIEALMKYVQKQKEQIQVGHIDDYGDVGADDLLLIEYAAKARAAFQEDV